MAKIIFFRACLVVMLGLLSISTRADSDPRVLKSGDGWRFVTDKQYNWYGPAKAKGVLVWLHGYGGKADKPIPDARPQDYVRNFNEAGFDIVRFERSPEVDGHSGVMSDILRQTLVEFRLRGWQKIVAAGQSRGGWSSLAALRNPGYADAVIAVSPAAQGTGQKAVEKIFVAWPALIKHLWAPHARVAFVQFKDDPFAGPEDWRADLVDRELRLRVGSLLLINQPIGYHGHGAGNGKRFADEFGGCLVDFVTSSGFQSHC